MPERLSDQLRKLAENLDYAGEVGEPWQIADCRKALGDLLIDQADNIAGIIDAAQDEWERIKPDLDYETDYGVWAFDKHPLGLALAAFGAGET